MSNNTVIGIDLAKTNFQIHIATRSGKVIARKKVHRSKVANFLANYQKSTIFMEACSSANFWGRKLLSLGHDVKLIAPQYVKPFVKGNKNDANDAEAICEAGCRENMNFVPIKSVEQQNLQNQWNNKICRILEPSARDW